MEVRYSPNFTEMLDKYRFMYMKYFRTVLDRISKLVIDRVDFSNVDDSNCVYISQQSEFLVDLAFQVKHETDRILQEVQ